MTDIDSFGMQSFFRNIVRPFHSLLNINRNDFFFDVFLHDCFQLNPFAFLKSHLISSKIYPALEY